MAFVALMPMLLAPAPKGNGMRLLCGFAFGYAHFLIALWWLNSVGFGAGAVLALICACFLAIWYWLLCVMFWQAKPREILSDNPSAELLQCARRYGAGLWAFQERREFYLAILCASALWVALEWLRSWIFTGFPWDLVGISQAFAPTRLLATLAGPYGISFVAILTNFLLAGFIARKRDWSCVFVLVGILVFVCGWCIWESHRTPELEQSQPLRIAAIQGNVPECREWGGTELAYAWGSYCNQTQAAVKAEPEVDMILWPEGALPCTLTTPEYSDGLRRLLKEIKKPILLGSLDERRSFPQREPQIFNSAFLLDQNSQVLLAPGAQRTDHYDKIHLVPFGEYVPYSKQFPWLVEMLGMGMDLTPGKEYHIFQLPRKEAPAVACGVNICFEDVFPAISRRFTLAGAQMLMTITNDCWYGTTAGARQHLSHAVFRAVENRRPLLRSGNNSDTCLISHTGQVLDPIVAPDGNPFTAGWKVYDITPFKKYAPLTIYAQTGNLFAWLCVMAAVIFYGNLACQEFQRKKYLREEHKNNA